VGTGAARTVCRAGLGEARDFSGAAGYSLALTMAFAAQAIILAAGRGNRMRPLTDHTPKPLLRVQGKALLQRHVDALAASGVGSLVINTAWLGEQIPAQLGTPPRSSNGQALHIAYSAEGEDFGYALETAGGIARALPLLADVFWVVAGDVFAPGFAFDPAALTRFAQGDRLAHLWLVPNPAHNPGGDFGLSAEGLALNGGAERFTYSTIGLYRQALFETPWSDIVPGNPQGTAAPLAPLLRRAMDAGRVSAELYRGPWTDVGTPERLAELNR
jgi:MurNAc alpha-1-phosphate uridylyltransferase